MLSDKLGANPWRITNICTALVQFLTFVVLPIAEVHAALAATLYHDKKQFAQAENQFAAATILDPRYNDVDWVKEQKVWPPSLLQALNSFLLLN